MPSAAQEPGSAPRSGAGPAEVFQITNAATAHSDDLDARIKKYLISMAIRTVCVVLVIVVHHPVRWVFAVGAVFLPYVAVIVANSTGRRRGRVALGAPQAPRAPIASAPSGGASGVDAPPVVLTGVVQPRPGERSGERSAEGADGGCGDRPAATPDPLRDTA